MPDPLKLDYSGPLRRPSNFPRDTTFAISSIFLWVIGGSCLFGGVFGLLASIQNPDAIDTALGLTFTGMPCCFLAYCLGRAMHGIADGNIDDEPEDEDEDEYQ